MNSTVVASIRDSAGKTSVIAGIMSALKEKYGYIKPLGDRLIYRRNRNWDYDSSLMLDMFGLPEEPESITLGFDHSKLSYMYNDEELKKAVQETAGSAAEGRHGVFIEAGRAISYGASIKLDSLSIARYTDSSLLIVVSGENDSIIDDLKFASDNLDLKGIKPPSVIINKVHDLDEFRDVYLEQAESFGFKILGVLPYMEELTRFNVNYIAEKFYAKIIAGKNGLQNKVDNVFTGTMTITQMNKDPLFTMKDRFVITSGDREDIITSAIENDASGILLTDNIPPSMEMVSSAEKRNIPMLLVTVDAFNAVRQLALTEALLSRNNGEMLKLLAEMVEDYIDLDSIFQ